MVMLGLLGCFLVSGLFRKQNPLVQDMYPHTVKCLLYIFNAVHFGSILSSKAMFALKQLCASRSDQKNHVGIHAIPHIIEALQEDVERPGECIYQSLLLLRMLSGLSTNAELMYKDGLMEVLEKLGGHPIAKRSDGFHARLAELMQSMGEIAALDK